MIVSAFAGAALGAWALNAALHPEGEGVLDRMTAIAYAAFRGFDLNLNGEVDLAEYRISQGAVTDYLVQPGGDPDRQSESQASIEGARAGYMFGSMLSGYDIDSVALVQHPDGLSEACWRALADGYNQVLERRFERMDLNADGMLYLDEYAEFNQAHWRSLFRSNDRDEDGDLTMDDMRQVFSEAFNGSEQVFAGPGDEPDYVRACRADVGPAEPRADRAPVPEERVTMSAQGMIDMWDMDANGRVTFDEFVIANSAPSPY